MGIFYLREQVVKLFYEVFFYFAYGQIYSNYLKTVDERSDEANFVLHDSFLNYEKKYINYDNQKELKQFEDLFETDKGLILTIINRKAMKRNIKNKKGNDRDAPEEAAENVPNATSNPIIKLMFEQVMKLIADNFKEQDVIIFKRISEGFTTKEISEELSMNENNVKTRIRRIREFIKKNI